MHTQLHNKVPLVGDKASEGPSIFKAIVSIQCFERLAKYFGEKVDKIMPHQIFGIYL